MQQPFEFSEFEPIKFGNGDETIWGNPTLSPQLTRDHKVAETLLLNLESDNDVANLLEIPTGQLLYILYEKPKRYTIFSIKKKSGKPRLIESPSSSIRILQDKLRPLLEAQYKIKKPVHGFVGNGKSIISNAEQHKKKNYLLNIDLLDFFHSVNFGRVQGIFRNTPFNMGYKAATVLAHLCTHNKRLPQGAPTSPVLSNLASTTLDKKLVQLAKRFQLTYTRYADDITFSSNRPFPPLLVETIHLEDGTSQHRVGKALKQAVEDSGFAVNPNKTRVQHRSQRQEVTGLIVNEGVNVNRKFIRNTRAMLHSWRKDLIEAEVTYLKNRYHAVDVNKSSLTGDIFKRAIYGRLSFIKMVKGQEHGPYLNLCRQALELDNNPPKSIAKLKGVFEMFDVFICHASEDKEAIALPLYDELNTLGVKTFIDKVEIQWGDSIVGKINSALQKSKFVVAIISESSIGKAWPLKELHAVLGMEIGSGDTKLLPLIVGNEEELLMQLPLIKDKAYLAYTNNCSEIAKILKDKLDTSN